MAYARRWAVGVVVAGLALATAGLKGADAPAEAPAADLATATLVTLNLKDVSPEDAFAALEKAAGVKFAPQNAIWDNKTLPESVSLEMEKKPFWEAFLEVCDKTGVGASPYAYGWGGAGGGRKISLVVTAQMGGNAATFSKRPHVIQGPYMLVANTVSRSRMVDLGNPAVINDNTTVQFSMMVEPRIQVGQMAQMTVDEAVDENGQSLVNTKMVRSEYMQDVQRTWTFPANASLAVPANAGKRIAKLKGSLLLNVVARMETFEVKDLEKAADVSKTIGGTTYTLREAKPGKQADMWEVTLEMVQENMDARSRQQPYAAVQASQLLDADGNAWTGNMNSGGIQNGKYTCKMTYYNNNRMGGAKAGVPVKFVMDLPAEVKEVRIPVEFKDLPLP